MRLPSLCPVLALTLLVGCRPSSQAYPEVDPNAIAAPMTPSGPAPGTAPVPYGASSEPWEPAGRLSARYYFVIQAELDCISKYFAAAPEKAALASEFALRSRGATKEQFEQARAQVDRDPTKGAEKTSVEPDKAGKLCPDGILRREYVEAGEGQRPLPDAPVVPAAKPAEQPALKPGEQPAQKPGEAAPKPAEAPTAGATPSP
jgi:hypothetical protein